ncbi:class I SAM-dependent methyltransferase [Aurantibacillus circumpalustris]|uniref:class I SAM-dependent methyltransferase n=1 Tax=Aurantibacillus circumpalustris TaxID=3036359 RepID=UPI00295B6A5F|nr:class I SAM-dependent methyltransferase [Aurantibacillus circumpalustris]
MSALPAFMAEEICCSVCGNKDAKQFSLKYEKENFAVVTCNSCSFHFIPPYYRKKIEYTQYKNSDVTTAVRAGNNWIKIQRHKLRFKFIQKFIKSGKLFDLGAGWGHFMLAGKELGYDVYGVEISEQPYLYCVNDLKLPVDHIDFFEMDEAKKFDLITMWDVLEHIDKANDFLAKCSKLTKPGGYLFLQVPQIDSYFAKRHKDNWKMMGLDHVNYFGKDTIKQILANNGYELVKIKSSFEIKLFIMYTLLPLIKKFKTNKKQNLRETNTTINAAERQQYFNKFTSRPMWQLKLFVFVHNIIYNTLSKLNIGEEMMVAARKVK